MRSFFPLLRFPDPCCSLICCFFNRLALLVRRYSIHNLTLWIPWEHWRDISNPWVWWLWSTLSSKMLPLWVMSQMQSMSTRSSQVVRVIQFNCREIMRSPDSPIIQSSYIKTKKLQCTQVWHKWVSCLSISENDSHQNCNHSALWAYRTPLVRCKITEVLRNHSALPGHVFRY